MLRAALAAVTLALTVGTAAAPAHGQTVRAQRGIVYAVHGGQPLALDLYAPAARPAGGAPAIVWIHGGGFHSGDRARMTSYAVDFARRGYVAATIDYRLTPHAVIQRRGYAAGERAAQVDAAAAVRWMRDNASRLGVDRRRIVVGGASAGAVTALNVAVRAPALRLRAAVALAGYGPPGDLRPGTGPMLLVHGTIDRTVPLRRAAETCAAARAVGVRCDLVRMPGLGHRTLLARRAQNAALVAGWLRRLGVG